MRCAVDGCPEKGRHDVGMSVAASTAKGTVETKLLVCVEHADEFRADGLRDVEARDVESRDVETASSAGSAG